MPKIPEAITQRVGEAFSKVRQVNPVQAKTSAARGTASVKETAGLVIGYVKQETVGPLKHIGRFLAWGLVAAVMCGTGLVLVTLGVLRFFQRFGEPNEAFSGSWNWVPYLLTVVVAIVMIALVFVFGGRSRKAGNRS